MEPNSYPSATGDSSAALTISDSQLLLILFTLMD
jgi:hypothetical protein